ncbi:Small nuclear ribonucleoprotein Sm D3 [Paecilomyces lecythidis]|uniref:Small nuclear ribonucleoprotein Sm D3 n=1 Tax=Paecilomyces lecythidis TaxID=3004212 RepID=A0ABR3WXW4_9EURO
MPTAAGEKSAKHVKNISNPRRLLILSPASHAQSTIPSLLHSLTGVPVSTPPQTATTEKETEKEDDKKEENPVIDTSTATTTTTFAGYTTHAPFRIETKYYAADVPIWVDEVPLLTTATADSSSSPSSSSLENTSTYPTSTQWKAEFLGADARVVRDAIGAVVLCVRNPEAPSSAVPQEAVAAGGRDGADEEARALKDLIKVVGEVKAQIEEERGGMGEVPTLLVLASSGKDKEKGKGKSQTAGDEVEEPKEEEKFGVGWWEDELYDMGVMEFEVVEWDPKDKQEGEGPARRNPFGELEGIPRIKEVLEATDWSASYDEGSDDGSESGFDFEVNELGREMMGLRFAIENGGGDGNDYGSETDNNYNGFDDEDDDQEMKVEGLETLMVRMQAIKDMSAELPEHERKSFAAKAVRDIMKEL